MRGRTIAGGTVVELAGFRLREFYQIGDVLDAETRVDRHDVGDGRHARERREIAVSVIAEFGFQRGQAGE